MRKLAILIALGATFGLTQAHAAQQPPMGITLAKLVGKCERLHTPQGDRSATCQGWIINMAYRSGRSQFMVMAGEDESLSFGGVDSPAKGDTAELAIDYVLIVKGKDAAQTRRNAIGTCTYTNPYAGPSQINCKAKTANGTFELHFVSDGSPPEVQHI
jgi:hypothetical protein